MANFFSMSIRAHLLLIVLVVALPATGIIIYSGIKVRNDVLTAAHKHTQELCDDIVTDQQNLVTGAEQLLAAVAQLPEVKAHDTDRVERILRELATIHPMYTIILIADEDGTVWASSIPVEHPVNIADRRYFKNAMANSQFSSGEYAISRITTKSVLHFGYPFKDEHGEIAGVIGVGFTTEKYRHLLQSMQSEGASFVLIDHRGIILSRGLNPEPFVGKEYPPEVFRQMRQGPESGTSVRKGLTSDKRIIAYRKIKLKGEQAPYMYVTAGVPVELALKQANKMLFSNVSTFSVFLLGALFLAWFIGKHSIVDRLSLLEQASERLATGDLDVRVSDLVTGGELGSLGQKFESMARKLASREKALRESEKFLATIIETEPECVKLLASDGSLLMMNRAGLDMFQVDTFDQVKGESLYPFIDTEDLDAFRTMIQDVFNGKERRLEFRMRGTKGRLLWLETHAVPLRNDEGQIVSQLGISSNITDRKRIEGERERLLVQMEAVLDSINEGVVIADLEGNIVTMNRSALLIYDYESVEQVMRPLHQYLEILEMSDFDGHLLPFEQWPLSRALRGEIFSECEVRVRRMDTGKTFSLSYSGTPVRNKAGEAILAVVTLRNITERKRLEAQVYGLNADLAARAVELEEANRELEAFNYTVAHDLRKPLTVVNGYTQILMELCKETLDEQCKGYLQDAYEGTLHMNRLIDALLGFSRLAHTEPKRERVDLCGICEEVASELKLAEPERHVTFIIPGVIVAEADPDLLHVVLGNLFGNAWKYTSKREEGIIEFNVMQIDGDSAYFVRDNGLGFDPAKAAKLFVPFQRLESGKEIGGLGIGLATVDRIIRRHGGKVWAEGEPGKGATFFFTLGRRQDFGL